MKLTELISAVAVLLIAGAVFTGSFINVRRVCAKIENFSGKAVLLSDSDALIRKEIKKIKILYWKNFENEFQKQKNILEERLEKMGKERGFEISDISAVYDEKHNAEGIKISWTINGKEYISREYIKQRIINGK